MVYPRYDIKELPHRKQRRINAGDYQFKRRKRRGIRRGKPALDGIEIHFIPDIEQRKTGLLDGTLDVIIGSGKKGFTDNLLQNSGIEIPPTARVK